MLIVVICSLLGGLFVPAIAAPAIDELKVRIAERSKRITELEGKISDTKGKIGELQASERTLANEIARLDRQIEGLRLDILLTEQQIEATELELEKLNLEIVDREEKISVAKQRLGAILRIMNETSTERDPLTLIFSAQNFSDIFDNFTAQERLEREITTILDDLKQAKRELEEQKTAVTTKKEDLGVFRETLYIRNTILTGEQNNREDLLHLTKKQESNFRRTLQDLEAQQRAIQREIIQFESQLRRLVDPSSLPSKGVLSWPVDTIRITQYYGPTSSTGFMNDQYDFHNGIDLAPPSGIGTPIYAAANGTVIGTGNLGRLAYGKWVAVDHHNGLVTLYAHLSAQTSAPGQTVHHGSVIGYMGSTGFSTGPHLHFTVYAAETFRIEQRPYGLLPLGASLNPLDFLE